MSIGESVAGLIVHGIFLGFILQITIHVNSMNSLISMLGHKNQNTLLSKYCDKQNQDPATSQSSISRYVKCKTTLKWRENSKFVSVCQAFTLPKTYPIRWYRVEGNCIIRLGASKAYYTNNIFDFKL